MHLTSHDLFCFGVILQKQTISSSESLSNVELVISSTYNLLSKYFQVGYLQFQVYDIKQENIG